MTVARDNTSERDSKDVSPACFANKAKASRAITRRCGRSLVATPRVVPTICLLGSFKDSEAISQVQKCVQHLSRILEGLVLKISALVPRTWKREADGGGGK